MTATGMFRRRRPSTASGSPSVPERDAGGQCGSDRREYVPAVEGVRDGLQALAAAAHVDGFGDASQPFAYGHQQPVVRSHKQPVISAVRTAIARRPRAPVVPTPGSTTARMIASGR